jgi:FAD/FMN-containing dehydrogenase
MTNAEVNLVRRDLAGKIVGRVLQAGDDGFANSLSIDNGRVMLKPFLVALPSNTEDVAVIVKYCSDQNVPLTTKAGGHSAAGYCLNSEGVVMDLGDMNDVDFAEGHKWLRVGAGTRWIKVYDFLRDRQCPYTVIGGGCAGVGVAGFTLGGGYSFISRSYGLGCDNVVGMKFVSTAGNVYELDNKLFENNKKVDADKRELYRSLRGAGGGNFGVVTRIDLQLHETVVRRPTMGQVTFPFYRINEILAFYNKWVLTLPNEMAVYGMIRNFPDVRFGGKPSLALRFTPVFNGKFTDAVDLLKPLMELGPSDVELYTMSLPEWEDFVGTSTQVKGHSAYIRSLVLGAGTLTDSVTEICKYYFGRAVSPDSYIVWTHTGGKIADGTPETSCYAHRDSRFTFELKSEWDSSQPLLARENIEWAVDFFDELGEHAQGSYINYIDPLLIDWKKRFYRNEYDRLEAVQKRWNKNGWLKFQQCIGSVFEPVARERNSEGKRIKPVDLSPLSRTIY